MADNRAILKISDGTDEIDLLQARDEFKSRGWLHFDWVPQIAQWKGDGTWSQSALSDGRQLRFRTFDNVIETINCKTNEFGQDEIIALAEDTLAMLEKAAEYWTADWATEPVYLICRATEETNTRYAIVKAGRIPELEDWYRQPFLQQEPTCRAMLDDINIIIERGHWQDTIPGNGNCLEISGTATATQAYPLVFDGDTSEVDLGSPAVLDDLPDFAVAGNGQIQIDAWVKGDGWGEGNAGIIAGKNADDTVGWNFDLVQASGGLGGVVRCAGVTAQTRIGTDDWTPDSAWHHLVMSYDETGTRLIYIAIDGVWVTTYSLQTASVGNYTPDNAANVIIGNRDDGSRGFDGEIGWLRIWSTLNYTVGTDFTPPVRCPLPGAVPASEWLGIHEGSGTTINDLSGNGNNGTAANTTWGDPCEAVFGTYADGAIEETCDKEVFVANKQNRAQLTHVFYYDASGPAYSANLLTQALPYDLLPAAPAAGDIVYFAVQTTVADSGPFCSLVFDLQTPAGSAPTAVTWEYWNGAWVALTVQDSTEAGGVALKNVGVRSVHWHQQTDWATTTVNTVTGYFVRARVTAAGAGSAPTQQNRNVYTVTWPYVEVQSDKAAGGALPNVIRMLVENQSDVDLSTAPVLFSNRMICGLRTYSRGADFAAYINFADEQNPDGITVSVGGVGAFANDVRTPTGRKITATNVPAIGSSVATIQFDGILTTTARQYAGVFHAFMRIDQTSGAAGDLSFILRGQNGVTGANTLDLSDRVTPPTVNAWEVVDFGTIRIPFGVDAPASELGTFYLSIFALGDGAVDCDLFDFVLIPVDEWAIDTLDPNPASPVVLALGDRGTGASALYYLDVDSITWPKRIIRSVLKQANTLAPGDASVDGWRTIANGQAIAQAHVRQRYYFLHIDTSTNPAIGSQPEVVNTVQMYNVQRYLGARGDR